MRSRLNSTVSALNGSPSWNFTPFRRLHAHGVSLTGFQASASPGTGHGHHQLGLGIGGLAVGDGEGQDQQQLHPRSLDDAAASDSAAEFWQEPRPAALAFAELTEIHRIDADFKAKVDREFDAMIVRGASVSPTISA